MKVIVLGAGLLGVTSAYFLRQRGHDVSVVDRQASPAAETSFANGGQISVSHAEPWANPSAPLKVLKVDKAEAEAKAMANWMKMSIFFSSFFSIHCSGSKSLTSAAKRVGER